MNRLISEFEVIRAIEKYVDNIFTKNMGDLINDVKAIPSVEPSDVLNMIKAEILLRDKNVKDVRTDGRCFFTADEIFEIIDKHIAEGREKNE